MTGEKGPLRGAPFPPPDPLPLGEETIGRAYQMPGSSDEGSPTVARVSVQARVVASSSPPCWLSSSTKGKSDGLAKNCPPDASGVLASRSPMVSTEPPGTIAPNAPE